MGHTTLIMFGKSWRNRRRPTSQMDGHPNDKQSSLIEALRQRGGAKNIKEVQQMKLETVSCADSLGGSASEDDRAGGLGGLDLKAFAPDAILKKLERYRNVDGAEGTGRWSGSSAFSSLSAFAFGPASPGHKTKFSRHSFSGGSSSSRSSSGKQSSSSSFNSGPPGPPQPDLKSALQARGGTRRFACEVSSEPVVPTALDPVVETASQEVSVDDGFAGASVGKLADQKANIAPVEQAVQEASEKIQEITEEGQHGVSNTAEDTVPCSGVMLVAPEPIPETAPEKVPEAASNTILVTKRKDKEKSSPEMSEVQPPSQETEKETEKCGAGSDMKEVAKKTEDLTRNFRFNPDVRWVQNPTAKWLRGFNRQTSHKSSELLEETAAPPNKVDGVLAEPNSDHKVKESPSSPGKKIGAGKRTINLNRDDSKENVWTLPRLEPNSKKTGAKSANKSCSSPTNPSTPVECFRDVSGFWEQKSLSFSGSQQQSKGKLTTDEAQATLMRLASAGRAVDFDEVRRLRKLLCEMWDHKS